MGMCRGSLLGVSRGREVTTSRVLIWGTLLAVLCLRLLLTIKQLELMSSDDNLGGSPDRPTPSGGAKFWTDFKLVQIPT